MIGKVLLNKYRVTRDLDEGGLCKLYVGRQIDQPREVAIKVLKDQFRGTPRAREHFRWEIHVMERFQHPHAVAYIDSAPNDPEGAFLVMEYLRGQDLDRVLHHSRRFSPDRAGKLLVQLCEVLQAAHEAGIVHRDLKPGNIFLVHPGTAFETVKLMDFGLAKMSSLLFITPEELSYCEDVCGVGTPEYVAPEQLRGSEVDARSDLYSLGIILFELLAGRRPFVGESPEEVLVGQLDQEPPTFGSLGVSDVPTSLEQVVRRCLAKSPAGRPTSASEVCQLYEKALGHKLVLPRRGGSSKVTQAIARPTQRMSEEDRQFGKSMPAPAPIPTSADRLAIRRAFEIAMPESIVMMKLKGFIHDLGCEGIDSVPGLIRANLPPPRKASSVRKSGFFSRLTGGGEPATATTEGSIHLELHMQRPNPAGSQLVITLILKPHGMLTPGWRERAQRICHDLQMYLMS
jgi:serine/threonine-protein kinase